MMNVERRQAAADPQTRPKIPTANLSFRHWELEVYLSDSNNHRQPEMAAETGNTYISGTVTYSVEIPTANHDFLTTSSLAKSIASDCDNKERPTVARLAPKRSTLPFPAGGRCRNRPGRPGGTVVYVV